MNLQFFREKANLTQEELAKKIGMSTAMVQSIEAGRRKGSIDTVVQIAKTLGITTDELLYAHDKTNSNKISEINQSNSSCGSNFKAKNISEAKKL